MEAPDALALEDAIILSGNPDTNIRTFKNENGVEITHALEGFIELKIPTFNYPVRFLINPYANSFRLKKFLNTENAEQELRQVLELKWNTLANQYLDKNGVNIFCGHFYFMEENGIAPEEPEDEKPLYIGNAQAIFNTNLPGQVQYAALGHLHRKQVISNFPCPVVYSGSPLAYSFSESFQKKYICIIGLEPGESAVLKDIELIKGRQLAREKFQNIDMAIDWLSQNQEKIVEITIESDEFLSAADRKKLYNAHDFIINIIPDIRNAEKNRMPGLQIDMSKNIKELFVDYFKSKNQQEPDKDLLKLFNEVLSHEDNKD
jgi:exonuclease SbcD